MSLYQCTDVVLALGGFLAAYKIIQIYEANGNKLSFFDVIRIYVIKYLRVAPTLIIVFLFGWVIMPRLHDGPNWNMAQSLYKNCDRYWWAQFLMIGNLVPFWSELNAGCNYPAWIFLVDFQLFLLVPIYVILFKKKPVLGVLLQIFLIIADACLLAWMSKEYGFRACYLTTEGALLFAYVINKPYTKFVTHSVGVLTAFAYMEYLAYRKVESVEVRRGRHPVLHQLISRQWLCNLLSWLGVVMIFYSMTSAFDSFKYQAKIPWWSEQLYWATNRFILVAGSFMILFNILIGNNNLIGNILRSDYFRSFSKVTFPAGLVTGICALSALCG